jgi:hypothetical protein
MGIKMYRAEEEELEPKIQDANDIDGDVIIIRR